MFKRPTALVEHERKSTVERKDEHEQLVFARLCCRMKEADLVSEALESLGSILLGRRFRNLYSLEGFFLPALLERKRPSSFWSLIGSSHLSPDRLESRLLARSLAACLVHDVISSN